MAFAINRPPLPLVVNEPPSRKPGPSPLPLPEQPHGLGTPHKRERVKLVTKKPAKRTREISSISFPYMDLDTGVTVARAFVANGGGPHTRDQLAGAMGQSPLSGAFIMKLSAARQFGLVDYVDGKFKLTDLGFSIVDKNEAREKSARVQAFLNVDLYRKVYEEFKGKQLPPRPLGLEQTFVQMGVSPKQKTNARLAFDRSARQAGFSTLDPDRLIEPMVTVELSARSTIMAKGAGGMGRTLSIDAPPVVDESLGLDPLVKGLLSRLPKQGSSWSIEARKKWLQTFEANLEMIYPPPEREKPISE
jgi:hypothetical protein